jgi:hypothetical protein
MAIKLVQKKNLSSIRFISQHDDAIDLDKSNYEEYKKTLDESLLVFVENKQPTIFVCNFELKGHESAYIKNSMISGTDELGKPQIAMGSWSFKVCKTVLKDIVNPDYLAANEKIIFKKDKSGYASDDLLSILDQAGIVSEIFSLYTEMTSVGKGRDEKN